MKNLNTFLYLFCKLLNSGVRIACTLAPRKPDDDIIEISNPEVVDLPINAVNNIRLKNAQFVSKDMLEKFKA